ncbi:HypC/HybG/HupF family hydrogenase formation chaperone [Actibacterium ureilyticum]|uniref:HypC/HybG/HupF family hydrogenase formation chaperone n=1 Tax=Actibacterium ureilyticum TaxID=1590614 RepID=UPI000BAAC5B1|nr:HypC/HybG/HupF family hydrogenase formation chaperone [Actibacterium ureilyticum]
MCLGIPMQILGVDGIAARATDGRTEALIDLSLTGPLAPGTWVLTFLGAAREVLDPDEAQKIASALDGLRALMRGEGLGDAFADLEQGEPRLPPHLRAALDQGKPVA